jgi:hypothetical protein
MAFAAETCVKDVTTVPPVPNDESRSPGAAAAPAPTINPNAVAATMVPAPTRRDAVRTRGFISPHSSIGLVLTSCGTSSHRLDDSLELRRPPSTASTISE